MTQPEAALDVEPSSGANEDPRIVRLTARGRTTRNKLLAAAREIFGQTGFSDVRIIDITGRAGVAAGTFYTYFDSKEQIFRELAAQVLSEMERAPKHDPENIQGDVARDIEYGIRSYFAVCRENAGVARSMEQLHTQDPDIARDRHEVLLRGVRWIDRWVRRLQERGLADPSVDSWPTALALHSMNVAVAYDQFVFREEPGDLDRLARAVREIWCRAIGLKPGAIR